MKKKQPVSSDSNCSFPRTRPIRLERSVTWDRPDQDRPFEKERIQATISRALLSVSQVRLSVSSTTVVIYHWQPMRCWNEQDDQVVSMVSGLRSLFRRHAETQLWSRPQCGLSTHPLWSCTLDLRFALCHLTINVWQTLSRHAANAMPNHNRVKCDCGLLL